MTPIVVCTVGSRSLPVLQCSVKTYNPDVELLITEGYLGNFGDDYNEAMRRAFELYDEIIIANDDIVLNPDTYEILMEDVKRLKKLIGNKLGYVAARSNEVRPCQNIRNGLPDQIIPAEGISPLFAWISKQAFLDVQFPPLNWFSDDVMCQELSDLGYKNFVSRAYVHHVGSTTIGKDTKKLLNDALPWIQENKPDLYKRWFG